MKKIESNIQILLNLFNATKYDLVIPKSKKLIREFPEYLILYNILGSAYQNTGRLSLAQDIFLKGYKMEPNNIAIMNNLANVYKNIGKIDLSENLFKKIIKKKPDYINAYINLGNLKRDNNDFKEAINLYKDALNINDEMPVILYSLALAYQGIGKFDLAIDYARKTLLIDRKFTRADILISQSTKYTVNNEHFIEMNLKINNLELKESEKVNLLFALAKANEDLGLIEQSFNNLDLGNKINRKLINFNLDEEVSFYKKIKEVFHNIKTEKISDQNLFNKNIIFILGMPRSGTSLVEQIISSHSNVFGAGELPQLSKIINDNLLFENTLSQEKIDNLLTNESYRNQLREIYYAYLQRFKAKQAFITDKAPLNFRWIGLIKILFPNSKIIHCSRAPKDNCLSLYKNFFEGGLNFSYNQKELGAYYKLYQDLMEFWNTKFTDSIYEAKYEQIIDSQQDEIKKIIKFCDLPWEENCLLFDKNVTPIKTMSTAQARQKIYKSSLNSFDKFAPFLKDLEKSL